MFVKRLQSLNHRSFLNSDAVEISSGVNVVVGPNSSGKTALLDVLRPDVSDEPYAGVSTVPELGGKAPGHTSYAIDLEVAGTELLELLKRGGVFCLPVPTHLVNARDSGERAIKRLNELVQGSTRVVRSYFEVQKPLLNKWPRICDPNFDDPSMKTVAQLEFMSDQNRWVCRGQQNRGDADVASLLFATMRKRTFRVAAERFAFGQGKTGTNDNLAPNAANLPECLNILQGRRAQIDRLIELVRSVLPSVTHIATRPISAEQVKIFVWEGAPLERFDLANGLDRCGTGVGQIIALLYLLVTATSSRLILLDEPQSFLHPGAVRALMDIIRAHPQHQYIIATHSPSVVGAALCDSVIRVSKNGQGVSSLTRVSASDVRGARATLDHLGASFESLFGARGVIWVEGPTEREVLPAIVHAAGLSKAYGFVFAPLSSTGDIVGRSAEKVRLASQVHQSVAATGGLLPQCPGAIIDRERTDATEQEQINGRSTLRVAFTKRRTFENYLINAKALSTVMTSVVDRGVQATAIESWLVAHANDIRWARGLDRLADEPGWLADVDAAAMLAAMWRDLCGNGHEYAKTTHSVQIALELLKQGPAPFQDYVDLILQLLA